MRRYFPDGTNGNLWLGKVLVCHTIELPWDRNKLNNSCIPEGEYPIIPMENRRGEKQWVIDNVPDRDLVVIYEAHHAKRELNGQIAPVEVLTGPGKGLHSKKAKMHLEFLLFSALEGGEEIMVNIESIAHAGN